jgi:hypothetical protein
MAKPRVAPVPCTVSSAHPLRAAKNAARSMWTMAATLCIHSELGKGTRNGVAMVWW